MLQEFGSTALCLPLALRNLFSRSLDKTNGIIAIAPSSQFPVYLPGFHNRPPVLQELGFILLCLLPVRPILGGGLETREADTELWSPIFVTPGGGGGPRGGQAQNCEAQPFLEKS